MALVVAIVLVGCSSDATVTTSAPATPAPTVTLEATTSTAPTTTVVATTVPRAPQPGFCDGNAKWSFKVPDGWHANLQAAGSRRSSCVVLQPRVPAADLHDGFFRLDEDELELTGYATVIKDSRESMPAMLGGAAINSGVDTAVTVTATGVHTEKPTPNATFQLVIGDQNPKNLQIVRFRAVMAVDVGYVHRGYVDYGFIISNPAGGTVRIAPSHATPLTEAEIMPALEKLIPTFAFK